jgi:hypothetical protein
LPEEGLVALQEKGAVEEVLGEDGEEGVEEEDEEPEAGAFAGEVEEEIGIHPKREEAEEQGGGGDAEEDAAEMRAGGGAGVRLAEVNPGVEEGEENRESGHAEENVQEGDAAVELEMDEEGGHEPEEKGALDSETDVSGGCLRKAGAEGLERGGHGTRLRGRGGG